MERIIEKGQVESLYEDGFSYRDHFSERWFVPREFDYPRSSVGERCGACGRIILDHEDGELFLHKGYLKHLKGERDKDVWSRWSQRARVCPRCHRKHRRLDRLMAVARENEHLIRKLTKEIKDVQDCNQNRR